MEKKRKDGVTDIQRFTVLCQSWRTELVLIRSAMKSFI